MNLRLVFSRLICCVRLLNHILKVISFFLSSIYTMFVVVLAQQAAVCFIIRYEKIRYRLND